MTTDQKQALFNRLTRNLAQMCGNDLFTKALFEQSTLEDIEAISPLIDLFILEGKMDALKELQAAYQKKLSTAKGKSDAIPNNTPVS